MKTKPLRISFITIGVILIIFIGYHLYLEYQTDIQIFLNPKASHQQLMAHIRSYGFTSAMILILLIGGMCAVPGVPTSVIRVLVGLSYSSLLGTMINVFGNLLSIFLMQHLKLFDHSKKSNRWVKAIRQMKHSKIGLMVGYMVPVIPSSLLYACGGEALFHG